MELSDRFPSNSRRYDRAEDYEGTSFHQFLTGLPNELVERHMDHVEDQGLSESATFSYFEKLLSNREAAITESKVSDETINLYCEDVDAEVFGRLEEEIFNKPDIGAGQTAKVKRMTLRTENSELPLAIKYLLTPTKKTLSASAEHDMIMEVERMQTIEEIEQNESFEHIKVPHPYLHHRSEKVQCYGMELVDGINLQELLDGDTDSKTYHEIREKILAIPPKELALELESFLMKMHDYCLHGDIKPKNYMVDKTGKFFLIDFGQSVLKMDAPNEAAMEQYQYIQEQEIENTHTIMRKIYKKLELDEL